MCLCARVCVVCVCASGLRTFSRLPPHPCLHIPLCEAGSLARPPYVTGIFVLLLVPKNVTGCHRAKTGRHWSLSAPQAVTPAGWDFPGPGARRGPGCPAWSPHREGGEETDTSSQSPCPEERSGSGGLRKPQQEPSSSWSGTGQWVRVAVRRKEREGRVRVDGEGRVGTHASVTRQGGPREQEPENMAPNGCF